MSRYTDSINFVRNKLKSYLTEIFKVYGNELTLRIEEYNLLSHQNNCIESSTATGFIIEEFVNSKLEIYSKNHNGNDEIKIERIARSTLKSSYDCYVRYNGILFMINIKVEKDHNNAVAAINMLYKDYVLTNPEQEKSYLVLKVYYSFKDASDGERKIFVKDIDSYALESIDFTNGHMQDHRNWSSNYNENSGRLLVSEKFKTKNSLEENAMSYEKTKNFIDKIYNTRQ